MRVCYSNFYTWLIALVIVSIYERTVMNGTSPRQINVHVLMSLANQYSCNLAVGLFHHKREVCQPGNCNSSKRSKAGH